MPFALTKSIRGRLLLWIALLLICILTGFGITAYQLQRANAFKQIDEQLVHRAAALSDEVHEGPSLGRGPGHGPPPPGGDFGPGPGGPQGPPGRNRSGPPDLPNGGPRYRTIRLSAQSQALFDEGDTNGFYFAFWSRDEDLLRRATNAPANLRMPGYTTHDTLYHTRTGGEFREAYHFTEMGECALAGRNIAPDLAAMRRLALWLIVAGAGVLALGLAGAGWLVGRSLQPVEKISDAARRISAGNLSERINVSETESELGHLAGTLNATFAQLETVFMQQAHFTADAAHELRTPVSVMLTHTQNGIASECTNPEHQKAFAACQRSAQRMRRLIESLLELARLDAGQETMKRIPFDLSQTIRDCVELVLPLANTQNVTIHCDLPLIKCSGDPEHFAQVITNLLTNAIQYNKPGGEVRISAQSLDEKTIVTVSDTGVGIPTEDLPRVFERFYRADKSRASGHSGLGLAICKAIVEAHGGDIQLRSDAGKGTEIQIRLPLTNSQKTTSAPLHASLAPPP